MTHAKARPILDNDPIDRLIVMAAALLDAPIAAVAMDIGGSGVLRSLRDGMITDRDRSECGEARFDMGPDDTLVIPDLTAHPQTADMVSSDGYPLEPSRDPTAAAVAVVSELKELGASIVSSRLLIAVAATGGDSAVGRGFGPF